MVQLLVIDLQRQFKEGNEGKYNKCLGYVKTNMTNYDNVVSTLFRQNDKNKNFEEQLGYTECENSSIQDLEYYGENFSGNIIVTNGYGVPKVEDFLNKEDTIDIVGCCSEAGVLAVCFQLWDLGIKFRVLSEYIFTSSKNSKISDIVLEVLKSNFGDCIQQFRKRGINK